MQTLRFLFWNIAYLFRKKTELRTFDEVLIQHQRCSNPWKTFKPYVYHNDLMRGWECCLADESYYVERRTMNLHVMVSQNDGRIIGWKVWDEHLRPAEAETVPA